MRTATQARPTNSARTSASAPHVLLITGKLGIGKATVLRRVAAALNTAGIRGFYTEEVREGAVSLMRASLQCVGKRKVHAAS